MNIRKIILKLKMMYFSLNLDGYDGFRFND